MIEILKESSDNLIGFSLSGKLHNEDYKSVVAHVESVIEREGKGGLPAHFHGWDLHAAWDDRAFGVKHDRDIEKIAMIGDRKWNEMMER